MYYNPISMEQNNQFHFVLKFNKNDSFHTLGILINNTYTEYIPWQNI